MVESRENVLFTATKHLMRTGSIFFDRQVIERGITHRRGSKVIRLLLWSETGSTMLNSPQCAI